MPPIFIATEKGFCYEPTGISTGWILWEDIAEVAESTIYAPLLKYVVEFGQKFHNYQTEGVGDILLRPSDFGDQYEKVLALFKSKTKYIAIPNG